MNEELRERLVAALQAKDSCTGTVRGFCYEYVNDPIAWCSGCLRATAAAALMAPERAGNRADLLEACKVALRCANHGFRILPGSAYHRLIATAIADALAGGVGGREAQRFVDQIDADAAAATFIEEVQRRQDAERPPAEVEVLDFVGADGRVTVLWDGTTPLACAVVVRDSSNFSWMLRAGTAPSRPAPKPERGEPVLTSLNPIRIGREPASREAERDGEAPERTLGLYGAFVAGYIMGNEDVDDRNDPDIADWVDQGFRDFLARHPEASPTEIGE